MRPARSVKYRVWGLSGRALFGLTVILILAAALHGQVATDTADRPPKTTKRCPDAVAVVVGISHYQNPNVPEAVFAARDAEAMREMLIQTLGYPSADVFVTSLLDVDTVSLDTVSLDNSLLR